MKLRFGDCALDSTARTLFHRGREVHLAPKAYEVLALIVFIPWAVATFGDPPRGRLHWLPAGLIGGLSIVLNWAFIIYGALGILAG